MLQHLGIGAIASMISKRKGVEEGSGAANDDADCALTRRDPDYNPNEDEVIDGEEVHDCVVEKPVKVHISSLFGGVGVYAVCLLFCPHKIFLLGVLMFWLLFTMSCRCLGRKRLLLGRRAGKRA